MKYDHIKYIFTSLLGAGFGTALMFRLGFLESWNGGVEPSAAGITVAVIVYSLIMSFIFNRWSAHQAIKACLACWAVTIILVLLVTANGSHLPLGLYANIIFWSSSACVLTKHQLEKKKKDHILRVFKSYISPELVEIISKDPESFNLEGEERELTILFSDLQGFTNLAEKISATELVSLMNQYFTGISSIIFKHGGTIDKFIGDAVMAFWNAPMKSETHAAMCVRAGAEIVKFSEHFFHKFPEITGRIGFIPKTKVGINTGKAIVGNVGSSERLSYTAMGDQINLTARIEGLNGRYGTSILLSESTLELLRNSPAAPSDLAAHFIDRVRVKGKQTSTDLYTITQVDSNTADLYEKYHQIWRLYANREFERALTAAQEFLSKEKALATPLQLLMQRCESAMVTPPIPEWDGSFEFKDK